MASKNLKKSIPLLETLSTVRDKNKRNVLLKTFESNLQRAIREISHNLLNGNVQLTAEEKKKLEKFKKVLRLLADTKTKKRRFRKIVVQAGSGFLPAVIPLIVSAISAMV